MRKTVNNIFIVMVLLTSSMLFTSCKAISAQNITNTGSSPGMNAGQGMNGGPSMNGSLGMNGNQGMNSSTRGIQNSMSSTMNANLMGKVISVEGNLIKIELVEQVQNNKSSNSNNGPQDVNGNQNNGNNNSQAQRGFNGSAPKMNYTGVEKTLSVDDNVNISQETNMSRQNRNDNSKSTIKVSDLKEGQVIMIWYKENTESVERISILQS